MGKDSLRDRGKEPTVTIPFRTKESLKKDNRKFSRELRELQRRFQEVTNVIHHLEIDYETSKDDAPPIRYGKLKEIIKRSTTEEILEKSRPPSPKDIKAAAKLAGAEGLAGASGTVESSNTHVAPAMDRRTSSRGNLEGSTGGLLASCQGFAGLADHNAGTRENKIASRDVRMSKKEVSTDNDQMIKDIVGFESKFLRAHNRLVKLRQDYDSSKGMVCLRRYGALKDMIKVVIEDKKLSS